MSFPLSIAGKYGWEKLTTTGKKHQLGTVMEFRDGRKFRYCFSNGAVGAGRLMSGRPISNAAHDGNMVVATGAVVGVKDGIVITNAAAPIVVDLFADGLMFINDDGSGPGGEGTLYRVKSHSVATTTGAITVVLDEEDGIQGEPLVAGTSEVGFIENEYGEANIWDAGSIDGVPIGWTCVDVADNVFFWTCTHGPTMALYDQDDNSVRGRPVIASTSIDGCIRAYDTATTTTNTLNQVVGTAMVVSVDDELQPIFATID